jgi:hypothetical protein
VFGQTAGREIYDLPIQTDLSNVVSFLELKFGITHRLGSSPAREGEGVPCLQVLTDFELFILPKNCKIAMLSRYKYLEVSELRVSQFTVLLGKLRRFESGGSDSLPLRQKF